MADGSSPDENLSKPVAEPEPDATKNTEKNTSRPKVKTGCNNCKQRRRPCDEKRPACTQCVQAGKLCTGYPPPPRAADHPGRFPTEGEMKKRKGREVEGSESSDPKEDQPRQSAPVPTEEVDAAIFLLAEECENLFQAALTPPASRDDLSLFEHHQDRFESWATYFGVFAEPSLSLDRRLKQRPDLQDLVVRLLDILKSNLLQVVPVSDRAESFLAEEDLDEVWGAIDGAIHRLNSWGNSILESAASSYIPLRAGDVPRLDACKQLALSSVKILYPDAREALHNHLGRAVEATYDRIANRKARHAASQAELTPVSQTASARRGATTFPTKRSPIGRSNALQNSDSRKREAPSFENDQVGYPQAPQLPEDTDYMVCEWCFELRGRFHFEGQEWRQHVNRDFRPYVCVSEECAEQIPSFENFRRWYSHMLLRHGWEWHQKVYRPSSWLCAVCHNNSSDGFRTPQQLQAHLKDSHPFTESQVEAIVHQSRIPVLRRPGVCPLCCFHVGKDGSAISTEEAQQSTYRDADASTASRELIAHHIAAHVQGFIFLAVRYLSIQDEDDNTFADIGSSRAASSGRSTREMPTPDGLDMDDATSMRDMSLDSDLVNDEVADGAAVAVPDAEEDADWGGVVAFAGDGDLSGTLITF